MSIDIARTRGTTAPTQPSWEAEGDASQYYVMASSVANNKRMEVEIDGEAQRIRAYESATNDIHRRSGGRRVSVRALLGAAIGRTL